MDFYKMVDYIVQEVLKRLEEQEAPTKKEKNRSLVIINGGNGNLELVMLELNKISKEYDLEVVFSEAGNSVVGVVFSEAGKSVVGEKRFSDFKVVSDFTIENSGKFLQDNDLIILPLLTKNSCAKIAVGIRDNAATYHFKVVSDFTIENSGKFLQDNDLIILPLLTKNSCAKIAVGIRDNAATYLISKALLAQKEIIAVYDSCIADSKTAYGNQINFNIEKLRSYGIIFVKSLLKIVESFYKIMI